MAYACPAFWPVSISLESFDLKNLPPHFAVASTAKAWLYQALSLAISREQFAGAFGLYSMFYEAIYSLAWLMRGETPPRGTLGDWNKEALERGFIDASVAAELRAFSLFRNQVVHGDWRDWEKGSELTHTPDVDGRIWQWFYHDDSYTKATGAVYRTLPQ